jgi:hypothetical protein
MNVLAEWGTISITALEKRKERPRLDAENPIFFCN